jgi:hypothetical protein
MTTTSDDGPFPHPRRVTMSGDHMVTGLLSIDDIIRRDWTCPSIYAEHWIESMRPTDDPAVYEVTCGHCAATSYFDYTAPTPPPAHEPWCTPWARCHEPVL